MSLVGEQVLLRIYLQSGDRTPRVPTHDLIMQAVRKEKLAGATILRGILGAGYHGIIQGSAWSLVQHVPVIVEIVDSAERIMKFVRGPLDQLMVGGMLTLERAAVMMYRHREEDQPNNFHLAAALKPLSTMPRIELGSHMNIRENGLLLRIFTGESDRFQNQPLYEAIVRKTRELGLAGATVLRGTDGFGARSVVHKAALLEMSSDLPMVIEIVDIEEKIKLLLPHLETMVAEGMITMEYVIILMYRHNRPGESPEPGPSPS
jgi:uncharacterized protein